MEVVATAKWVRTTARKARLVSASVTGLPVAEALVLLQFTPRAAATDVAKAIKSAAANAEHNYNLDVSSLRVARIEVEGAAVMKRGRPKPRGMFGPILKRTSHIRAFVTDEEPAPEKRRRSVIVMPRAVAPTPTATTTTSRRRRPAKGAAAATAETATADTAETKPARRRRGAAKEEAAAAAAAEPTDETAAGSDVEAATATTDEPAEAGEGETEE